MRPLKLLMATVVLCVLASPSWAYYDPLAGYGGADITMHIRNYDVGTLYMNLPDGTYNSSYLAGLSTTIDDDDPYKIVAPGAQTITEGLSTWTEGTWGIFIVDDIYARDIDGNPLNNNKAIWRDGDDDYEVTGIFWHEKDVQLVVNGAQQYISGVGMYAALFAEQNPVNTYNDAFVNKPTNRSGTPELEGVTESNGSYDYTRDGTAASGDESSPLWTFKSVTGFYPSDSNYLSTAEFYTHYDTSAAAGEQAGGGGMLADTFTDPFWGAGYGNERWQDNPSGSLLYPHSVRLEFNTLALPYTSDGWLLESYDPLEGAVTPELPSGALMLLGLVPLGLAAWRRRKED